ncbi:hypothetical protein Prum_077530 [Phytohabitans rumicis]|uniref:TraD/TraG TraM recognition site domain-containing protein n=1 Tax=Phytohabitans rumicis TaxID=1076125 RepID=A0A6V8LGW9_9ACTN|nr:hypothetical protein Prum_077530 [Phytohabitans rumicis]
MRLLFAAGRRLGWVFEDPWQAFRPYRRPRPVPNPDPDPDERRKLERAVNWARDNRVPVVLGGAMAGLIGLGCVTLLADIRLAALVFVGIVGVAAVLAELPVRRARADVDAFDRRCADIRTGNVVNRASWEQARERHEAQERDRIEELAEWRAQELPPTSRRLDVFGGTHWGWEGLLTVFGSSTLGAGVPLTVVDLSGATVTEDLVRLAREHGHDTRVCHLPDDLPEFNPFAGMDAEQTVDTLVDLINPGPDATIDHYLLTEICAALGTDITINRILAAVRVAAGQRPDSRGPAGADPGPLGREERRHIAEEMFTDEYRQGVIGHLQRIESELSPLRRLGERPTGGVEPPDSGLLSIVTPPQLGATRRRMFSDLLVRWLTHKVHTGAQRPRSTLVIAGADDIATERMERLASACDRRGVHLVTFHARLRRDPRQAIGSGAVAFMRLGDDTEAAAAAQFIGRDHRFVLSQLTHGVGQSESLTVGGTPGWRWVSSVSVTEQQSRSSGQSRQRVYEYAVEPTTLQSIPEYALLLVTHQQGKAVVQAVECSPSIVLQEKFLPLAQRVRAEVPTSADRSALDRDAPTDDLSTMDVPIQRLSGTGIHDD